MFAIDNLPRLMQFGFQGEKGYRTFQFDLSAWAADYPDLIPHMNIMLPRGTEAYPMPMDLYSYENPVLTLRVDERLTGGVGRGAINIEMRDGDTVVKKTGAIAFEVKASLPPARGPMPDPVRLWTEDAQALLDRVAGQVLELIFNNATSELTLKGANTVLLNRGLTDRQYNHLSAIMARPYGTWVLNTGPVYSQTSPGRDIPGRKSCRVEWGLGIIHLDFVAAAASGDIGYIPNAQPNPGPKAEILIEEQLHDGSTVWIDQGSRTIKAQGLQVGQRYLFNIIGFFV
jgi:hypothetical protein